MAVNRITSHASVFGAPKSSQPAAPAVPNGFVFCPPQLVSMQAWQQEVYRLAYERAQAATQIPRHHRLLFSVWN